MAPIIKERNTDLEKRDKMKSKSFSFREMYRTGRVGKNFQNLNQFSNLLDLFFKISGTK